MVLSLATSACSYKHSGKAMVGGAAMAGAGLYVFRASAESEGDTTLPTVAVGVIALGVIIGLAGFVSAVHGPEPEAPKPVAPPEPPPPPAVMGSEDLRSQKRVAQYMAEHGRCDQVMLISARVEAANAAFHAGNFATDKTIARCLVNVQR